MLTNRAAESRADLTQHLVAGVVAERVVELLEAVKVDQKQRQLAAAIDRRLQPLNQVTPVCQAGQIVGVGTGVALAQPVGDRHTRARHAGKHGDDRERSGSVAEHRELPQGEQRQGRGRKRDDRGEHRPAELRSRTDPGLGPPGRGSQQRRRGRRHVLPSAQRDRSRPDQQHAPARLPAAERQAGGHAAERQRQRGGPVECGRHRRRRRGSHHCVKDREPRHPAEAVQHDKHETQRSRKHRQPRQRRRVSRIRRRRQREPSAQRQPRQPSGRAEQAGSETGQAPCHEDGTCDVCEHAPGFSLKTVERRETSGPRDGLAPSERRLARSSVKLVGRQNFTGVVADGPVLHRETPARDGSGEHQVGVVRRPRDHLSD